MPGYMFDGCFPTGWPSRSRMRGPKPVWRWLRRTPRTALLGASEPLDLVTQAKSIGAQGAVAHLTNGYR